MISKAVLDALAEVLKLERVSFQKLISELRDELTDKQLVVSDSAESAIVRFDLQFTKVLSDIEAFDEKSQRLMTALSDDVTERFAALDESWTVIEMSILESVKETLDGHGVDLKQDIEQFKDEYVAMITAKLGEIKNGEKGDQGDQGERGERGKRGEKGLDGEVGQRGPAGIPGEKGKSGAQGRDGADGDQGEKGERGDDGEPGLRGEKGEAGADGRDGVDGDQGEKGERGEPGLRGEKGEAGADGRDGVDGEPGSKGDSGRDGVDGVNGKNGVDGDAGADGNDGRDGRDGVDGVDKYILSPRKAAPDEKLDKNELVCSQGGIFQAKRKTIGCPQNDAGSYDLVVNGIDHVTFEYDAVKRMSYMNTRMSDGEVFTMELDDGGQMLPCKPVKAIDGDAYFDDTTYFRYVDGEWLSRDLKGDQGNAGPRGRKGIKGDAGVSVEDVIMEGDHMVVILTNGDSKAIPMPTFAIPEQVKMQGVHGRAPKDPPEDYLWVNRSGQSQIWDGKQWIKIK